MIEGLLSFALTAGVSDLFVNAGKKPAFRKKGKVLTGDDAPVPAEAVDAFRIKVIGEAGDAVYRRRGAYDASCALSHLQRFRVNFFTTLSGPSMVVRPIRLGNDMTFESLDLPAEILNPLCDSPRGIILVAGSTGSGKSTTLAAMINRVNSNYYKHILTLEDPIEYLHEDVRSRMSQRELDTNSTSFGEALRSALRENPDVIVVGEMRDTETMQVAVNAALTGHLVISTVHTSNTIQAVERIINMFPSHQREQIAADLGLAMNAIIAQRLLPCKSEDRMIPALEIMLGTSPVRKFIATRDFSALEDALKRGSDSGMITFNRAIFRLYKNEIVSYADARAAVDNPDEFELLVKGMESGVDAFRNHYGIDSEDGEFVDMRSLLKMAVATKASDMHLTNGTPPILRINGALRPIDLPPLASGDIQRLLYSVISQRQRIELEEKRELDLALAVTLGTEGIPTRFRVNGFFQRGSLGVVARVVNTRIPSPEELTLPGAVTALTEKNQGLILVTGPTGSGKSTTLASLIDRINSNTSSHIITIEDPIEYVHGNKLSIIEQRELHSDTLSFASALKYALRQDPDVIMVGEMRDTETIAAAITAAETGHLVFATIHTNSAPQTIDRIIDSFPTAQQNQIRLQLASALLGVVSQRLIQTADGNSRVAAFEILIGTPPVQALIREGKNFQLQSVIETSYKDGMISLEKSLQNLYERGLISYEATTVYKADYKPTKSY